MKPTPTPSVTRSRTKKLWVVIAMMTGLLVATFSASLAQEAASDETSIKLLTTNDFHGRLLPPSGGLGGAAYLATHLDAVRDDNTLYVDAGDLVGATPVLSNLFYDEPTVEVMNLIGMDIQTVGNHEFDRGQDEILRRRDGGCLDDDCTYRGGEPFEGQEFTTLSTNVIVDATGEALTQAYDVIEVDGVGVGFIGVTTENTPIVVSPVGIAGLSFLPEVEAINSTVDDVIDAGADVVVVLMHEGGRHDGDANSCENFAGAAAGFLDAMDPRVDVLVTGHTHQAYVCDIEDGPLVTQAFEYGKMFTEIDLVFDRAAGELVARGAENHEVTQDVDPDAEVLALIERYEELAGPALVETVGTSEVFIPRTTRVAESAQGNLATDALLYAYADAEIDFAFQNSGGLRADLTKEANLDADTGLYDILREDVLEVWPFGNIVALAEITGEQLEEYLNHGVSQIGGGLFIQVGGLRIDYTVADPGAAPFPRGEVVSVEYWGHPDHDDGTPVDLSASATYRIALNDFMAYGGDGYPDLSASGTGDVFSFQDPLELAVEAYLADNSPVAPEIEGRIVSVCADDPSTVNAFPDVAGGNPFCTDIAALTAADVIRGFDDGTFRPMVTTTRQAMAAFLYRLAGSPEGPFDAPEFSDVGVDHPFATEIAWMASEGLTEGYADGTFRPTVPATRQATAAFLYRLAGAPVGPFPDPGFSDVDADHPFATEIAWAADAGITQGYEDGTFRPVRGTTRMATAALLNRV